MRSLILNSMMYGYWLNIRVVKYMKVKEFILSLERDIRFGYKLCGFLFRGLKIDEW